MTSMKLRILAAIGEDPPPEAYLEVLLPLSALGSVDLTLFRVVSRDEDRAAARAALGRVRELYRRRGLGVSLQVASGAPAKEIVALALTGRFDCILMATHARGILLRTLLGSVTEEVLRHAPVPVLAFRPGVRRGLWKHVALAVDGSPEAECILNRAVQIAKACKTPLHLVRAHPPSVGTTPARTYLLGLADRLARDDVASIPFPRRGTAVGQILSHLRRMDVGLLCMTTHGSTGIRSAVLGSVAGKVLRRSPCAVLIRRIPG